MGVFLTTDSISLRGIGLFRISVGCMNLSFRELTHFVLNSQIYWPRVDHNIYYLLNICRVCSDVTSSSLLIFIGSSCLFFFPSWSCSRFINLIDLLESAFAFITVFYFPFSLISTLIFIISFPLTLSLICSSFVDFCMSLLGIPPTCEVRAFFSQASICGAGE